VERYTNKVFTILTGVLLLFCYPAENLAQKKFSKHEATVQWVTAAVRAPRLQHRIFYSEAAKSEVSYHIYTPELYDIEKKRHFPVLYWLHGHGGGLKGMPYLVKHFDLAIRTGKMPPMLIVFPNGMFESMWCNSKDGKVPMETVVVKELVPHIDATFRTIDSREGRLIEGFSMGGYGAARLGFKYHDIFCAVSILGAGPLQQTFTASVGPKSMADFRTRVLQTVYGSDQDYFKAQSPWVLAEQNAAAIGSKTRVRQVVGDRDETLNFNRDFDTHLTRLGISHTFTVLPNIAHNTMPLLDALGEANWKFYSAVFGTKASDNIRIGNEPLAPWQRALIVRHLKTFDHDGDGRIHRDAVPAAGQRAFRLVDTNQDGIVDAAELRSFSKE